MPHEVLHVAEVGALPKQMRRKTVAQGVNVAFRLSQVCSLSRRCHPKRGCAGNDMTIGATWKEIIGFTEIVDRK